MLKFSALTGHKHRPNKERSPGPAVLDVDSYLNARPLPGLRPEESFLVWSAAQLVHGIDAECGLTPPIVGHQWNELEQLAMQQRLLPLLGYLHKYGRTFPKVPPDFQRSIEEAHSLTIARSLMLRMYVTSIVDSFNQQGIDPIVLKGIPLENDVYPQPGLRPSSDIDLLVSQEELTRAEAILVSRGFVATGDAGTRDDFRRHHHHLAPYIDQRTGVVVEIHQEIISPSAPYSLDTEGLQERARVTSLDGMHLRVLSSEDQLLHSCIHFSGDRLSSKNGALLQICDIALLIKHRGSKIDWEQFVTRAHDHSLSSVIFLAICATRLITGVSCPEQYYQRLNPDKVGEEEVVQFVIERVIGVHGSAPWTLILALSKLGLADKLRFIYGSMKGKAVWSPSGNDEPLAARPELGSFSVISIFAWLGRISKIIRRPSELRNRVLVQRWLVQIMNGDSTKSGL